MSNIGVAIDILDARVEPPPRYSKTSRHLVFDIKIDFTQKAQWVLNL